MTATSQPQRTRVYLHHHLQSSRWDGYSPREGDIIVTTSLKAGTTWMQRIVSLLVFGAGPLPAPLGDISPWVDSRFNQTSPEETLARLDRQEHRRFMKSHLPFDSLPYFPEVSYVFVCRDTRDVFMSLLNHYGAYTPFIYQAFGVLAPESEPFPPFPGDPHVLWEWFMTRSYFPWEEDGYPFWSHHYHAASYWPYRSLPNVLFVHYADLKADLEGEMRRLAAFLEIDVRNEDWPELVDLATFDRMKEQGDELMPGMGVAFDGGSQRFLHKGTNGRWHDVLSADELQLYDTAAAKLDPALRRWMENGRLVAGDPRESWSVTASTTPVSRLRCTATRIAVMCAPSSKVTRVRPCPSMPRTNAVNRSAFQFSVDG